MSIIWSVSIFILNLYMLVTCIYWAATGYMPDSGLLFFTTCVEIFLVCEIFFRCITRIFNSQAYNAQNFLHTRANDGFVRLTFSVLGSSPICLIYIGLLTTGTDLSTLFSRLMLIKILRTFEIYMTLEKIEELLFYKRFKTLVFVKFINNFMQIILVTHIEVCAFLFV
jgi:hypothetical protein